MQHWMNPKKKRSLVEFSYVLPFILLVAVFSYFPLYGWRYAFHDFVPPKPINSETFVGFKWFASIFSNDVKIADVKRVMVNTLAMSGISLFIQTKRTDVNDQLCTYTWKLIFAKDEADFEALWDEMIEKMDGFGFKELYAYDVGVYQVELDMKLAAVAE